MSEERFRALLLSQGEGGATQAAIGELEREALPAGDVLLRVAYSSINYKDGLAITGTGKIIRSFPFVPGIDAAGSVVESSHPAYAPGDQVILTGWGVGERHWGGLAQYMRLKGDWLVPLPAGLSLRQAMGIGTAGLTAMIAVLALEHQGLTPGGRPVLVTGAAGGVGSIAVALLARLGYEVVASTGRAETHDYLRGLGAASIIERGELTSPGKPLESERWAGAVDTVGGETLAGVLRSLAYFGSVAACGNAGGVSFTSSVFPFILRGVNLLGVESVMYAAEKRRLAWERLARELPSDLLDSLIESVPLEQAIATAQRIVKGQVRGRVVVDVNA
jgi:acrylyl-CoA reductase (NADPH)